MTKNTLQELVGQAHDASLKGSHMGSSPVKAKLNIEKRVALRSIRRALLLLSLGLGFLALAFGDSWVTDSPLFNVVGSVACFLFLLLCGAAGIFWWLVTGSGEVADWAVDLLPFFVQPYRSVSGIVVVVVVIALFCPPLLRVCSQLPRIVKHQQALLVWLRRLLWLLTIGVWLAALWLNMARFLETAPITAEAAEYSLELSREEILIVHAANNERAKRFCSESLGIPRADLAHHESQFSCVGCAVPYSHDGNVIGRITDSKLT